MAGLIVGFFATKEYEKALIDVKKSASILLFLYEFYIFVLIGSHGRACNYHTLHDVISDYWRQGRSHSDLRSQRYK